MVLFSEHQVGHNLTTFFDCGGGGVPGTGHDNGDAMRDLADDPPGQRGTDWAGL